MDRRSIMAGLGALMAAPALSYPSSAFAAPVKGSTINAVGRPKGPRLRPGDTVGLIEPATNSDEAFDIQLVEEAVMAMGLKPKRGKHVLNQYGYLAGQDKDRAADLNAMFADKDVRAIFAVRGGWGSARLLPFVDWDVVRMNPKFVLGFSDITALHMAIAAQGGAITMHGPNASSAWGKSSVDSFRAVAWDAAMPLYANPVASDDRLVQRRWRTQTMTGGKAQGHLLGGNLTVLTALAGTPYLPSFKGAILFLEDVDEAEYRIDRMLTQIGQAGVLSKLAGVVFGQCTSCTAPNGGTSPFTLNDVLRQHLGSLGVPAFHGAWFGHIADQPTLPVGARAEIDADAGTLRLLESAVA
jgi:muramoyltetrapeptide carboxypeptidase